MFKNFAGLVLLWVVFATAASSETYNAILISLDGAQRAHMNELFAADKLPAMKELKTAGAQVDIKIVGHDTATGPGHAQMLTGLPKEINNVYNNDKYKAIPKGCTIGERLETALGADNIVTVMVMGKAGYMGSLSPADYKEGEKPAKLFKTQPYNNAKKNIDKFDGEETRLAEEVAPLGMKYIEKYKDKRFFMFFHLKDTDTRGHGFGENSPEYEAAFIEEDAWIGKIMAKLKELKLYDKTLIYVTADHGFDEGETSHNNAPDVFLVTNDKTVKENGTQGDIVPTILTQFNVDLSKLEPKLPGKALNR